MSRRGRGQAKGKQREPRAVETLVADLAAGAGTEDRGHFTLERGRARELLRERRLETPGLWAVLLVQSAALRGARSVRFTTSAREVDIVFDGAEITGRELDGIYDAALGEVTTDAGRSLAKLAVALSTLEGMGLARARLDSGAGALDTWLELAPGAPERCGSDRAARPDDGRPGGTRLRVTWSAARPVAPEVALLRDRCRYAAIEVVVDGVQVSRGPHGAPLPGARALDLPTGTGETAMDPTRAAEPELRILQQGVWVASHALGFGPHGFVVLVEAPGLRLDLSLLDVVRDPAFDQLVEAAQAAARDPDRVPGGSEVQAWTVREARARLSEVAVPRRRRCLACGWSFGLALGFAFVACGLILWELDHLDGERLLPSWWTGTHLMVAFVVLTVLEAVGYTLLVRLMVTRVNGPARDRLVALLPPGSPLACEAWKVLEGTGSDAPLLRKQLGPHLARCVMWLSVGKIPDGDSG